MGYSYPHLVITGKYLNMFHDIQSQNHWEQMPSARAPNTLQISFWNLPYRSSFGKRSSWEIGFCGTFNVFALYIHGQRGATSTINTLWQFILVLSPVVVPSARWTLALPGSFCPPPVRGQTAPPGVRSGYVSEASRINVGRFSTLNAVLPQKWRFP